MKIAFTLIVMSFLILASDKPDRSNNLHLTPLAKQAMEEADRDRSIQEYCMKKYGAQIAEQTKEQSKSIYELDGKERELFLKIQKEDKKINDLRSKLNEIDKKDTLSNVGIRNRRELGKMIHDSLEIAKRNIQKDPRLQVIRNEIKELNKQRNAKINAIMQMDSECQKCFQMLMQLISNK